MSRRPTRVAVVGVGEMGANHARVYSQLKDAELVAVVDPDANRAAAVADRYGARALPDPVELVGAVDAASVAVPSSLHASVAGPLLEAGIACLVEKPLATNRADAEALLCAADRSGAGLVVGHVERFNPAVDQLRQILGGGDAVVALDARRMSAVSGRIKDVDVVLDLMVHDIDIVLSLVGGAPVDIVARAVSSNGSADYATALLRFSSGALAALTASRITQNQIRELHVTTPRRLFTVDYSAQELLIFQQGRIGGVGGASAGADGRYVLDVNTERVFVRRTEPLVQELAHFVEVARGDAEPAVSGVSALAALDVVWAIQDQIGGKSWLT